MTTFNNHKSGDFVPGKGYFHICPVCQLSFWDRKNKIYCGLPCKNKFSNDNRSELTQELQPDLSVLMLNFKLMKKFYRLSLGKTPLLFSKLVDDGFRDDGPMSEIPSNSGKEKWYCIGNYVLKITNNGMNAIIDKSDNNGIH